MLLLILAILLSQASRASAQFTLNFEVDRAQTIAAIGPQRLLQMNRALDRVKSFLNSRWWTPRQHCLFLFDGSHRTTLKLSVIQATLKLSEEDRTGVYLNGQLFETDSRISRKGRMSLTVKSCSINRFRRSRCRIGGIPLLLIRK
jgi:hypothetical protein